MKNSQATKEEVNAFLKEFKERAQLFGIIYVDSKPNNIDTLTALDITQNDRKNYVLSLDTEDYNKDRIKTTILDKMTFGCLANKSRGKRFTSRFSSMPYSTNPMCAFPSILQSIDLPIH